MSVVGPFAPTRPHGIEPGDNPVECDSCGFEYRRSQMTFQHVIEDKLTSILVCPDCRDEPEVMFRPLGIKDPVQVKDARPPNDVDAPQAPNPTISAITPATRTLAQWQATPGFTVTGTYFKVDSRIFVGDQMAPTTYVSPTTLTGIIAGDVLGGVGVKSVTVQNVQTYNENGIATSAAASLAVT